jgi:hypothetical protein
MTMDLIDTCLAETKRTYPDGYGFALTYLRADAGPDHFKAMRESAWKAVKAESKKGNPDASRFVAAYTEANASRPNKGWPWWLIEAAQLVLAAALSGSRDAAATLRLWGHPGY